MLLICEMIFQSWLSSKYSPRYDEIRICFMHNDKIGSHDISSSLDWLLFYFVKVILDNWKNARGLGVHLKWPNLTFLADWDWHHVSRYCRYFHSKVQGFAPLKCQCFKSFYYIWRSVMWDILPSTAETLRLFQAFQHVYRCLANVSVEYELVFVISLSRI